MPQLQNTSLVEAVASLADEKRIAVLARESGLVKRQRKLQVHTLIWTLILGFSAGRKRTLVGMLRVYEKLTEMTIAYASFYGWFRPELVRLLKRLTLESLEQVSSVTDPVKELLARFNDVVLADCMVIRLRDALQNRYPGCRTNHTQAAAKIHTILTVRGTGGSKVRLTSERTSERKVMSIGPWVKDKLLLQDLGYYKFQLFDRIQRNGGWFISRLKSNANPVIVEINRLWRGRSIDVVGKRLQEVVGDLKREELDVMVEVSFKRRSYGGKSRRVRGKFRVVGIRDEASGEYHLYLTNLSVEQNTPSEISQLYAARWCIELVFRELAEHHRVRDLPTENLHVVESLIYASLLSMIASRRLIHHLQGRIQAENVIRLSPERVAAVFAQESDAILNLVVAPRYWHQYLSEELERHFLRHGLDPHRKRQRLLSRIDQGLQDEYMKGASNAA